MKTTRVRRAKSPKVLPAERMYRLEITTPAPPRASDWANRSYRHAAWVCETVKNTNGARVVSNYLRREYGIETRRVPA